MDKIWYAHAFEKAMKGGNLFRCLLESHCELWRDISILCSTSYACRVTASWYHRIVKTCHAEVYDVYLPASTSRGAHSYRLAMFRGDCASALALIYPWLYPELGRV